MSEQSLRLVLDETFDREAVMQIRALLKDTDGITIRASTRELGNLSELISVMPIAAIVVSTATLVLNLIKFLSERPKDKTKVFDFETFQKQLSTELAKLGILNAKLLTLDNFSALTDCRDEDSILTVQVGTGETVRLRARRSKDSLLVRQESSIA